MPTLTFYRPQASPLSIKLTPRANGERLHLVNQIGDQFALSGSIEDWRRFIAEIEPYLASEPGILRDDPVAYNLISLADVAGADEPMAKYLVYQKFLNSPQLQSIAADLPADWKKLPAQPVDDVDVLTPHLSELIGSDGQPVRGAQTRAAEILGFPQTGGSYRKRIVEALEGLRVAA